VSLAARWADVVRQVGGAEAPNAAGKHPTRRRPARRCELCLMQGVRNTPLHNKPTLSHAISCVTPARGGAPARGVEQIDARTAGGRPKRRWKAPRASWLGTAREFSLMQGVRKPPIQVKLARRLAITCPTPARGGAPARGVELVAFGANGRFVTTRPDPRRKRRNGAARHVRTVGLLRSSCHTPLGWNPRGVFGSGQRRRRLHPAPRGLQWCGMASLQGFSRFARRSGCPGMPRDEIPKS